MLGQASIARVEAELSKIDVYASDRTRLQLLQRAWGQADLSQTVRRLLDEYTDGSTRPGRDEGGLEVPVHALYEGVRTEGVFHRVTGQLHITSGVLAGKIYRTPSGAAAAVVRTLNRDVHPNRNGWTFWIATGTGLMLQALRRSDGAGA